MATKEQEEQWQRADEELQQSLPSGVTLERTLRGHTGAIGRIAWSHDGRMLASPSGDKTIRLWDAQTGQLLRILEGHEGSVASVAFHPDGQIIASGSSDKTVKLWDMSSGQLIHTLRGWVSAVTQSAPLKGKRSTRPHGGST